VLQNFECARCGLEISEQDSTTHNGQAEESAVESASQVEEPSGQPTTPSLSEREAPTSPSPSIPQMTTEVASIIPLPTVSSAHSHNSRAAGLPTSGLSGWRVFRRKTIGGDSQRGSCIQAEEQDNPKMGLWETWLHKRRSSPGNGTWTMRQAYFVVAGGLAVDSKSFWGTPYLTLTPAGVVELARLGFMLEVTAEIIDDKSKTDSLGKILVSFQAGWFIIQCIARTVQGLPLSLLEVHVLAHVAVALVMYLFWFKKPYNALSPIVLTDPAMVEMAALFVLGQQSMDGKLEDQYPNSREFKCVGVWALPLSWRRHAAKTAAT
jgi:hypothetical protein